MQSESDIKNSEILLNPNIKSISKPFLLDELRNVYVVKVSNSISLKEFHIYLDQLECKIVEGAPQVESFWTPNDYSSNSYHLDLIHAEDAWDIENDASDIVIAVIDDAVDINHSDLADNIWYNSLEVPSDGIDNDGNGFIDDFVGWDFGNLDNDPSPNDGLVNLTHGTHVCGIAAGVTNNSEGISSIGANAKILPIKIAESSTGILLNPALSIDYAIAMNVDIINMSWGGPIYSEVYQVLFNAAAQEGILCVASSGNSSSNFPMFPASYENVISVASTNQTDEKSWFSNFGPTVDIAAPGSDIYSSVYGLGNDYETMSGTSMSGPMVAGLLALMKSANPLASAEEIESCLLSSADPVNGLFQNDVGAGRINALAALECITELTAEFASDFTQICVGNQIQFYNYSSGNDLTYQWEFEGGSPSTSNEQNPIVQYNSEGEFEVSLTISDGVFTENQEVLNYIYVTPPSAAISGFSQVFTGGFGSILISFEGNAPYSFTIEDGTNSYSFSDILEDNFSEIFQVDETTDYQITAFSDSQCNGTFNGLATIEVVSLEDSDCDPATSSFIKYLGTDQDDYAFAVSEMQDLGYLVMGRKTLGPANFRNYIALVNNCGTTLWENIYNTSDYGIATSGHLVGDQIKVVGYDQGIGSSQTYLLSLDLDGNVLDTKHFGGNNSDYPRKSVIDNNGDLVIGGVTNSAGSFGSNDHYITKSTTAGSIIWSQRIGGTISEFLQGMAVDSNNDIIAVGKFDGAGTLKGSVIKVDTNGDLLWTREIGNNGGNTNFGYVNEINGFYYVTGYTSINSFGGDDGYIIKLDSDGNTIWSKLIGGTSEERIAAISFNGTNLIAYGYSYSDSDNSELMLIELTEDGDFVNSTSFGSDFDEYVYFASETFQITQEGSLLGTGNIQDLDFFGGDDIFVFKFPEITDLCETSNSEFSFQNASGINNTSENLNEAPSGFQFDSTSFDSEMVVSNQGFLCSNIEPLDSIPDCNLELELSYSIDPCELEPVEISVSNSNGIILDYWFWEFGDGEIAQGTSDEISHFYNQAGTYNLNIISGNLESGCLDTLTETIEVFQTESICSIGIENTSNFCLGEEIQFNNASFTDDPDVLFDWDFGIGAVPQNFTGENPPSVSYNSSGIYQVELIMHLACGDVSQIIDVSIFPEIDYSLPDDTLSCSPLYISLGHEDISSWNYFWTPETLFDEPENSYQDLLVEGNTTIYLEITDDWTGCSLIDSMTISVDEPFLEFGEVSNDVCLGEEIFLPINSNEMSLIQFSPQYMIEEIQSDGIILMPVQSGYFYGSISSQECSVSDSVLFNVSIPITPVNISESFCLGTNYYYTVPPTWNYSGNLGGLMIFDQSENIVFSEQSGCGLVQHSLDIEFVDCNCELFVPNAFTPNFDEINQTFGPVTICEFDHYLFQVYNRWGELIFETSNPDERWSGTYKRNMVQDGIYTWKISYSSSQNPVNEMITGHVTIVR